MFLCIVIIIMHSCKYFMPHLIFDWLFWFINEWIVLCVTNWTSSSPIRPPPRHSKRIRNHSHIIRVYVQTVGCDHKYWQSIWLAWTRFNSQLYAQRRVCNYKIMDVFHGIVFVSKQFWVIPWRLRVGHNNFSHFDYITLGTMAMVCANSNSSSPVKALISLLSALCNFRHTYSSINFMYKWMYKQKERYLLALN